MRNKFQTAIFLAVLSFLVYSFFQFPGFQGYEDETYNRIVTNLETGEFKTARSGYAQTLLETPFVLKGQILDKVFNIDNGKLARLFALLYNPFITATSVAVIFLIFNLYSDKKRAFWLSFVYAFGTMAFPYASIGMEPTAVLFILLSVCFLLRFGKFKNNQDLVFSGVFFFLLLFSKAYYLVAGLAYVYYLFLLAKKNIKEFIHNCLLFALPLLIIIPLYLLANQYNFGAYLGGQYKLSDELLGGENPLFGVYGLLLGFGKSLFIYNPVLILSVIFFRRFYKQFKNEAIFVFLYAISLVLFVASIHWWSDETWGPRYLLSLSAIGLLPLISLPFVISRVGSGLKPEPENSRNCGSSLRLEPPKFLRVISYQLLVTAVLLFSFFFQLLGSLARYDVFPYSFYEIYGATKYNVLTSQEYQYVPQFAPYFVNYQLIKNKALGQNKPLKYKMIYTPPMELAARERGSVVTKEIVYDNNKYQAHVLNFWWMNVPGVLPYKFIGLFTIIFVGLVWWGRRLLV